MEDDIWERVVLLGYVGRWEKEFGKKEWIPSRVARRLKIDNNEFQKIVVMMMMFVRLSIRGETTEGHLLQMSFLDSFILFVVYLAFLT